MIKKTKSFKNVKFPLETIFQAFDIFKSLLPKGTKNPYTNFKISHKDERLELDQEQFCLEYKRLDFVTAGFSYYCYTADTITRLEFSVDVYSFETNVSISLPKIIEIEKVLSPFINIYDSLVNNSNNKENFTRKPKYSIDFKIHSSDVSIQLIRNIEDYIIQRTCSLENLKVSEAYENFSIYIFSEKSGDRSFQSINDYNKLKFPDDIRSLYIKYDSKYSIGSTISVGFSLSPGFSKIEISFRGDNSQEVVEGIITSIRDILKDFKNNNFLFNPSLEIRFLITIVTIGLLIILFTMQTQDFRIINSVRLLILVSTVYSIGYFVKPFIVFDTIKNDKLKGIKKYLWEVLIGGIIVAIVATWIISFLQKIFP